MIVSSHATLTNSVINCISFQSFAQQRHHTDKGLQVSQLLHGLQVVADIDNDLEVGVFLGAYRQLAQRQDLETRRLCAESCAAVLKAATPRRSASSTICRQFCTILLLG